jgi:hypothetical protein
MKKFQWRKQLGIHSSDFLFFLLVAQTVLFFNELAWHPFTHLFSWNYLSSSEIHETDTFRVSNRVLCTSGSLETSGNLFGIAPSAPPAGKLSVFS